MGGVISNQTSLNTSLTDIMASQVTNNSSSCNSNTNVNQNIKFIISSCGGDVNISNVTNTSKSSIQAQCEFKNLNKNSIENSLINNLQSKMTNSTSGMQLGNVVDTNQFVSNFIENNVDLNSYISNITSCVNNFSSDQTIDIKIDTCNGSKKGGNATLNNISNDMNVGIINKCMGENESFQDTQNTISNISSTSTDNTTKGIDPLAMFLLLPILLGVGGILLLFGLFAFFYKYSNILTNIAKDHPKKLGLLIFIIIVLIIVCILIGVFCNPNKQKETSEEIAKDTIRQLGGGSGFILNGTRNKSAQGDNIKPPVWKDNTLISGQQAQIGINYEGNLICYESKMENGSQKMKPIGSACLLNSGAYVCFSDNINGKIKSPTDSSKEISYSSLYQGKTCMDIATKNNNGVQPPIFCMYNCNCDKTPIDPINKNVILPPKENPPNYTDNNFNNNLCISSDE